MAHWVGVNTRRSLGAFSGEVDSGSPSENASKTRSWSMFCEQEFAKHAPTSPDAQTPAVHRPHRNGKGVEISTFYSAHALGVLHSCWSTSWRLDRRTMA